MGNTSIKGEQETLLSKSEKKGNVIESHEFMAACRNFESMINQELSYMENKTFILKPWNVDIKNGVLLFTFEKDSYEIKLLQERFDGLLLYTGTSVSVFVDDAKKLFDTLEKIKQDELKGVVKSPIPNTLHYVQEDTWDKITIDLRQDEKYSFVLKRITREDMSTDMYKLAAAYYYLRHKRVDVAVSWLSYVQMDLDDDIIDTFIAATKGIISEPQIFTNDKFTKALLKMDCDIVLDFKSRLRFIVLDSATNGIADFIKKSSRIVSISFSNLNIYPDQFKMIINAIGSTTSNITSISLSKSNITSAFVAELIGAVNNNTNITNISFKFTECDAKTKIKQIEFS